jgi:F420-dependent oxidoreductase-like protein
VSISLGFHIGQQNLPMSELRALWRRLDDGGSDWISVWDHLYEAPPAGGTVDHFEAVATLGALAADTRQARLGCLVFSVAYRNPGLLAKAAVTIDHISGGRFELGLGAGWHQWEAEAFGYDFPGAGRRLDMLEEAVSLIRSLLTEPRTTHAGRYFRTENASCQPRPLQSRLPIWVGGTGERRTMRIAARYADGWNAAYVSADRYRQLMEVLDNHCQALGRDPGTIHRTVNVIFGLANDGMSPDDVIARQGWGPIASIVRNGAISGSPNSVAEQIQRYVDAGAEGVNVALRAPWDDGALDQYLEQLPLLRKLA